MQLHAPECKVLRADVPPHPLRTDTSTYETSTYNTHTHDPTRHMEDTLSVLLTQRITPEGKNYFPHLYVWYILHFWFCFSYE